MQKSKEIINTKFRLLVTLEGKTGYDRAQKDFFKKQTVFYFLNWIVVP